MADMTAVSIALIAIIPACIVGFVPFLIERHKAAVRERERAEDKAEMREVARRAEEVAQQARDAATTLATNTEKAAIATKELTTKVDVVHVLVNSNLAAVRQRLLNKQEESLKLLIKYDPTNKTEIEKLKVEIAEIKYELFEQSEQTKKVEKLIEASGAEKEKPLPVADERTAVAAEKTATAAERSAAATERVADAAEEVSKKPAG